MSYTTVTFQEVRLSDSAKAKCPQCGKARKISVSRTYYRNGFHNESETRDKYRAEIAAEIKALEKDGLICQACDDANNNIPITRKRLNLNDRGLQEYDVLDRATEVLIGVVTREQWGSCRWMTNGLKWPGSERDRHFQTLSEAALELRDASVTPVFQSESQSEGNSNTDTVNSNVISPLNENKEGGEK